MNIFWPDIQDKNDAHKACGQGAGVAFFVAAVTGVVAWLQMHGKATFLPNIGGGALIDAGLFLAIGIGICFHSRLAALAGLLLYVAERVYMIKMSGPNASGMVSGIIFTLGFVASVRGAFAWHEFRQWEKKHENDEAPVSILPRLGDSAQGESQASAKPARKLPAVLIAVLFLISFAGGYFLVQKFFQSNKKTPHSAEVKSPQALPRNTESARDVKVSAPESLGSSLPAAGSQTNPGQRTFHLKSGAVVSGRVIRDDEVYYIVETSGKRQEIVIKEDIASEN